VLDSAEILAAVRRSLEEHVLPELTGSFARVQVEAVLNALAEVGDRLERGDPCARVNARIEAGVREFAESIRAESPALAESLDTVLAAAPETGAPRDWSGQLGEALWEVFSNSDDPRVAGLREVFRGQAVEIAREDGVWICEEAIRSLM
jgi:HAMP domain-containing protein